MKQNVIEIYLPSGWNGQQCSEFIAARFRDPVLWGKRSVLVILENARV
jgi:hypothetical protein